MTMFNKTTQSFRFGDHDVTLETGEIARQATQPAASPGASSNAKAVPRKRKR